MSLGIQRTNYSSQRNQNHSENIGKQQVGFAMNKVVVEDSFNSLLKNLADKGDISNRFIKKLNKIIKKLGAKTILEKCGIKKESSNTITLSSDTFLGTSPLINMFRKKPFIYETNEFVMKVKLPDGRIKEEPIRYLKYSSRELKKTYNKLLKLFEAESQISK
jgi:hypothetical protein